MLSNYQLTVSGFEPRLITSLASARREASGLSKRGYSAKIHRLTKDGPKFVASYAAREEGRS